MKKHIYLDYAASTPTDKKVLEVMMPYIKKHYGNPSSLHSFGQTTRAAIERAREQVALFLGCSAGEVIFTGGATEANNLAIQGAIKNFQFSSLNFQKTQKPHIVTTAIEHESVLDPCRTLEKEGKAEVTYVKPQPDGIVKAEDIEKAIQENTVLVSVMYANSQIGTIQPVEDIGEAIARIKSNNKSVYPVFHIDAVQGANFLNCNADYVKADLMTLSGHKIYGPKGIGVLYKREKTPLAAVVEGGGQEMRMRSGTENVAAVVGMGQAIEEIFSNERIKQNRNMEELRNNFITQVLKNIPGSQVTGSMEKRLINNVHFRFPNVEAYNIVVLLDQKGIAASVGSACSEKTQEPSHVLLSMGLSSEEASSAVRFTLGKYTTTKEIKEAVKLLDESVTQLQKVRV